MATFRINLKEDSWWEEHRGAIIFWSGMIFFIVFAFIPWLVGSIRILKMIF